MPKITEREIVKQWGVRFADATRKYKAWSEKYECDTLEDYYYGHQHGDDDTGKYVINLFYPSINVRRPSMLFAKPHVSIKPRPGRADDNMTMVEDRAKLQQDTLNTLWGDPKTGLQISASLAVQDAQFRFGVIETGYNADMIDNPNAGKPMFHSEGAAMVDGEGQPVIQPGRIIQGESLYYKWIPAKQFRVSVSQHPQLEQCDWVGYYEWHYLDDVKANPRYKNTSGLNASGKIRGPFTEAEDKKKEEDEEHSGMVRVLKIWNLRADKDGQRHRYVICDGAEKFLMDEPYKTFPFNALGFDPILGQWYPLPPTRNWKPPQDELNESREGLRTHRKRFNRQFQTNPGMDPDEKAKWAGGEDGTLIEAVGEGIRPIDNAPADPSLIQSIPQSKEDFREISGVSGEDIGIADADTATQANILETRSRIRESFSRKQVADWLARIAATSLEILTENMALEVWIRMNVDASTPGAMEEAVRVGYLWKQIRMQELGALTNDVSVDVESLSPAAEVNERNAFNGMLALVTNPAVALFLAQSDVLLRKALGYYGIKTEREVREVQKAMQQTIMIQAQMAAGAAEQGGGVQGAAPGPTPSNGAIQGQLEAQMPAELMQ